MSTTNPAYHGFPYSSGANGNVLVSNAVGATWANLDITGSEQYKVLLKRVEDLEKRLCVLYQNDQLHEKYPALKEAYEAYKIIDKLINGKSE